ncbi:MAG TPA: hypothetical protein DEB24_05480 [Coriobacteriia bacterium]|nr:hypothetical protein [Coriobacteriia bacterium]
MLSALWEKEKKDTMELMKPFVLHSVWKTTPVNNEVVDSEVSAQLSAGFGFSPIPYSVLRKIFARLAREKILRKVNGRFILDLDIRNKCFDIDSKYERTRKETNLVVTALTTYLNEKREKLAEKLIRIGANKCGARVRKKEVDRANNILQSHK